MKVYLAARFDRGPELRTYRDELQSVGLTVTSRWLDLHGETSDLAAYDAETMSRFAVEDLEDIYQADVLIAFTERPTVGYTSGGRHVEVGYALAHEKPVLIVGHPENIFYQMGVTSLTDITVVDDWHAALAALLGRAVRQMKGAA